MRVKTMPNQLPTSFCAAIVFSGVVACLPIPTKSLETTLFVQPASAEQASFEAAFTASNAIQTTTGAARLTLPGGLFYDGVANATVATQGSILFGDFAIRGIDLNPGTAKQAPFMFAPVTIEDAIAKKINAASFTNVELTGVVKVFSAGQGNPAMQ